jgi:hypothetical protein
VDVDASERRPGGGGRGSHERHPGLAGTGCRPVTDKRPELVQIQEPEAPVKREVLHISGIRSAGPATPRPVGRPWPRHISWREHLRRAKQKIGV